MPDDVSAPWFTFDGVIEPMAWGRATYTVIRLPADLVAAADEHGTRRLGGHVDEVPVNVAITRAPVQDGPFVYVGKSVLRRLGATAGDVVAVRLRPVDGHVVRVPKDVRSALSERDLVDAFEALSPGERRGLVSTVESAATPATRRRRIEELLDRLRP